MESTPLDTLDPGPPAQDAGLPPSDEGGGAEVIPFPIQPDRPQAPDQDPTPQIPGQKVVFIAEKQKPWHIVEGIISMTVVDVHQSIETIEQIVKGEETQEHLTLAEAMIGGHAVVCHAVKEADEALWHQRDSLLVRHLAAAKVIRAMRAMLETAWLEVGDHPEVGVKDGSSARAVWHLELWVNFVRALHTSFWPKTRAKLRAQTVDGFWGWVEEQMGEPIVLEPGPATREQVEAAKALAHDQ